MLVNICTEKIIAFEKPNYNIILYNFTTNVFERLLVFMKEKFLVTLQEFHLRTSRFTSILDPCHLFVLLS